MGRTRDWVRRFIYRRARRGRLVYALGANKRICAIRGLPNRPCDRSLDFANARFDLKPMESAEAAVEFELKEMEGHATNVHYFGGVQFQQFGLHHVEIYLQEELRLRFPLPVVRIQRK